MRPQATLRRLHAPSFASYPLKPEYRRFVAIAGLDDEEQPDRGGSAVFAIHITKEDVPVPGGAPRLDLVVTDAGDGIRCDHADWAQAGFVTGKG